MDLAVQVFHRLYQVSLDSLGWQFFCCVSGHIQPSSRQVRGCYIARGGADADVKFLWPSMATDGHQSLRIRRDKPTTETKHTHTRHTCKSKFMNIPGIDEHQEHTNQVVGFASYKTVRGKSNQTYKRDICGNCSQAPGESWHNAKLPNSRIVDSLSLSWIRMCL